MELFLFLIITGLNPWQLKIKKRERKARPEVARRHRRSNYGGSRQKKTLFILVFYADNLLSAISIRLSQMQQSAAKIPRVPIKIQLVKYPKCAMISSPVLEQAM